MNEDCHRSLMERVSVIHTIFIWTCGWDSNSRCCGFAIHCIGPLCHRYMLLVQPVGIEPTPLVLQTSVRTSYTKGPLSPRCYFWLACRTPFSPLLFILSQHPYRDLMPWLLWDTVESNHTFLQNDFTDRLSHQWLKHPNFCPLRWNRTTAYCM